MEKNLREDYVSYEVAKLLKEKGFPQEYDIYHSMVYNEENYENEYEVQRMMTETEVIKAGTLSSYPVGVPEPKCYCPTHQMAMKWLREVHNIKVNVFYSNPNYAIEYFKQNTQTGVDESVFIGDGYDVYEQACEVAIKYCLKNLI